MFMNVCIQDVISFNHNQIYIWLSTSEALNISLAILNSCYSGTPMPKIVNEDIFVHNIIKNRSVQTKTYS